MLNVDSELGKFLHEQFGVVPTGDGEYNLRLLQWLLTQNIFSESPQILGQLEQAVEGLVQLVEEREGIVRADFPIENMGAFDNLPDGMEIRLYPERTRGRLDKGHYRIPTAIYGPLSRRTALYQDNFRRGYLVAREVAQLSERALSKLLNLGESRIDTLRILFGQILQDIQNDFYPDIVPDRLSGNYSPNLFNNIRLYPSSADIEPGDGYSLSSRLWNLFIHTSPISDNLHVFEDDFGDAYILASDLATISYNLVVSKVSSSSMVPARVEELFETIVNDLA